MNEVFVIGIIFFTIVWIIDRVIHRKSLHRERMKLIENNEDPKLLVDKNFKGFLSDTNTLKYGLVAIGASIGSLIGSLLEQNEVVANSTIGYFFSISLFVGIALVLCHYLTKKKNNDA